MLPSALIVNLQAGQTIAVDALLDRVRMICAESSSPANSTEPIANLIKGASRAFKDAKSSDERFFAHFINAVTALGQAERAAQPGLVRGLCATLPGTINRCQNQVRQRQQWLRLLDACLALLEQFASAGNQATDADIGFLDQEIPNALQRSAKPVWPELGRRLLRIASLIRTTTLHDFTRRTYAIPDASFRIEIEQLLREECPPSQRLVELTNALAVAIAGPLRKDWLPCFSHLAYVLRNVLRNSQLEPEARREIERLNHSIVSRTLGEERLSPLNYSRWAEYAAKQKHCSKELWQGRAIAFEILHAVDNSPEPNFRDVECAGRIAQALAQALARLSADEVGEFTIPNLAARLMAQALKFYQRARQIVPAYGAHTEWDTKAMTTRSATCLIVLGREPEAIELLSNFISQSRTNNRAAARDLFAPYYLLAQAHIRMAPRGSENQRYETVASATQALTLAEEYDHNSGELVQLLWARLYRLTGDVEKEALVWGKLVAKLPPLDQQKKPGYLEFLRAEFLVEHKRYEEAEHALKRLLDRQPGNLRAQGLHKRLRQAVTCAGVDARFADAPRAELRVDEDPPILKARTLLAGTAGAGEFHVLAEELIGYTQTRIDIEHPERSWGTNNRAHQILVLQVLHRAQRWTEFLGLYGSADPHVWLNLAAEYIEVCLNVRESFSSEAEALAWERYAKSLEKGDSVSQQRFSVLFARAAHRVCGDWNAGTPATWSGRVAHYVADRLGPLYLRRAALADEFATDVIQLLDRHYLVAPLLLPRLVESYLRAGSYAEESGRLLARVLYRQLHTNDEEVEKGLIGFLRQLLDFLQPIRDVHEFAVDLRGLANGRQRGQRVEAQRLVMAHIAKVYAYPTPWRSEFKELLEHAHSQLRLHDAFRPTLHRLIDLLSENEPRWRQQHLSWLAPLRASLVADERQWTIERLDHTASLDPKDDRQLADKLWSSPLDLARIGSQLNRYLQNLGTAPELTALAQIGIWPSLQVTSCCITVPSDFERDAAQFYAEAQHDAHHLRQAGWSKDRIRSRWKWRLHEFSEVFRRDIKQRVEKCRDLVEAIVNRILKQLKEELFLVEPGCELTGSVDPASSDGDLDFVSEPVLDIILENLIRNAVRASADRIHVKATIEENPRRLVLVVSDDGPGFNTAAVQAARQAGWDIAAAPVQATTARHPARVTHLVKTGQGLGIVSRVAVWTGGASPKVQNLAGGGAEVTVTLRRPPASEHKNPQATNYFQELLDGMINYLAGPRVLSVPEPPPPTLPVPVKDTLTPQPEVSPLRPYYYDLAWVAVDPDCPPSSWIEHSYGPFDKLLSLIAPPADCARRGLIVHFSTSRGVSYEAIQQFIVEKLPLLSPHFRFILMVSALVVPGLEEREQRSGFANVGFRSTSTWQTNRAALDCIYRGEPVPGTAELVEDLSAEKVPGYDADLFLHLLQQRLDRLGYAQARPAEKRQLLDTLNAP